MLRPRTSPAAIHRAAFSSIAARRVHITSTAPTFDSVANQDPTRAYPSAASSAPSPDARFQVLGSPFSLLSVSLSASQNLYTRRGTLVGLTGKVENTVSTLSLLEPVRRSVVGIPFLYQKISSTSPVTALIATKTPISSIVTVNLDGRQDWVVAQRRGLLAWTGHSLILKPKLNFQLNFANWGNTYVTGRGLLALAGSGQIYQIQLKAGENYVVHPSNIVAYSASDKPTPFRFKSSNIRFQIPDIGFSAKMTKKKFFRVMSETPTWRTLARLGATMRTWARRSIWGDRLFLHFEGPSTILLQSRASRISDVLSLKEVNEIAEAPPGAVQDAIKPSEGKEKKGQEPATAPETSTSSQVKYAKVGSDGKIHIGNS